MLKKGIYEHIINQETEKQINDSEEAGLVCLKQLCQKLEDTEAQQDRVNLINRIMIDAGLGMINKLLPLRICSQK